jgi:aspartate kinase
MVVMKFGGTSVTDREAVARLAGIVRRERDRGRALAATGHGAPGPLVVVSALARVTDELLEILRLAAGGRRADAGGLLDGIRVRHREMVDMIRDAGRRRELLAAVDAQLDELTTLVQALGVIGEVSPRSQDAVAAVGELLSSHIVAAALADDGLDAVWVDARHVLVTTADHTAAQPLAGETTATCAARVRPLLDRGRVPVLGGFIGATPAGITTTLGRGGSDYSASVLGACGGAAEIQVWTDVDGMLTADPRIVGDPRVVERLSFDEASELAYFGAKVLHPSTILPAVTAGIPVRILSSHRPDAPGTLIVATPGARATPLAAIACKRGVTKVDITSTRMLMAYGFLRRVFEAFERVRTPVDVVTTSEVSVSVTIDDRRRLDEIVEALSAFAGVACEDDMAIVCAVGEGLRDDPALGTRVIGALEGLPLAMVSQGGSRKNITVVLPDRAVTDAMCRLHDRFFSGVAPRAVTEAQAV